MSIREEFEAWWEINYHNGKPPRFGWAAWRDGDGYKIDDDESELDGMWNAWQVATSAIEAKCAVLAAELQQSQIDAGCYKKGMEASNERLVQVAAENAGLKSNLIYWDDEDSEPVRSPLDYAHGAGLEDGEDFEMQVAARMPNLTYRVVSASRFRTEIELVSGSLPQTPATDAYLAEVRAQARNEGINYAASRLAAAFNHGFVDKPLTEVCDVMRMILDTKEDLANSTLPAADGLSGEYAEKFLEEFAAQLRQEAAQ